MADISKINAVLIANIAEIDDVLAANIAKVNGLVFSTAPAFTGLLDTYTGAAAAFSTRRLYGQYTGAAMRVREDSGDTETDIGFDSNGDLDTAAIASHCGSANGYVTKWYGQESSGGTGSGNDATQTTSGSQPQIYNGTAVITENGQPSLQLDGTNDYLEFPASFATNFYYSVFAVRQSSGTSDMFFSTDDTNRYWADYGEDGGSATTIQDGFNGGSAAGDYVIYRKNGAAAFTTTTTRDQYHTAFYNGNQILMSFLTDGTALNSPFTNLMIGAYDGPSLYFGGTVQELIMYQSTTGNQSSNASGIEGNVNAHFKIGNFGTPTSGLLYDYSGAAAAYSVRQLSNTSALAMRIREDGTDTETDIGFDSNGDLDTAAISSHCGVNNGYVVTWYDQAGSQNDATQATTGSQPQIYNGTAVITDNGKPALDTGSTGKLNVTQLDVVSAFYVARTTTLNYANFLLADATSGFTMPGSNSTFGNIGFSDGSNFIAGTNYQNDTNQHLVSAIATSSATIHVDGVSEATGTASSVSVDALFDGRSASGINFEGKAQEIVLWTTDQASNRTGIETDINGYFSIY